MAQMTIEALAAAKILKKLYGIECEIIDLRIVKPLDLKLIIKSVKKLKIFFAWKIALKMDQFVWHNF